MVIVREEGRLERGRVIDVKDSLLRVAVFRLHYRPAVAVDVFLVVVFVVQAQLGQIFELLWVFPTY